MKLLITGGGGYIGSHACIEFMAAGYEPLVVDNFSNSHPEALRRVETIAGRPLTLIEGDVRERSFMRSVFAAHEIGARRYFYPSLSSLDYVERQPTPVCDDIAARVLCLPHYYDLSGEEVDMISRIVIRTLRY